MISFPDEFFLNEKKVTIKRKYTEKYPAKNIYTLTPVRRKILEFVDSKGKVSYEDIKNFIFQLKESGGKKPTMDWFYKNQHLFKKIKENDNYYFVLSKMGARILEKTRLSESYEDIDITNEELDDTNIDDTSDKDNASDSNNIDTSFTPSYPQQTLHNIPGMGNPYITNSGTGSGDKWGNETSSYIPSKTKKHGKIEFLNFDEFIEIIKSVQGNSINKIDDEDDSELEDDKNVVESKKINKGKTEKDNIEKHLIKLNDKLDDFLRRCKEKGLIKDYRSKLYKNAENYYILSWNVNLPDNININDIFNSNNNDFKSLVYKFLSNPQKNNLIYIKYKTDSNNIIDGLNFKIISDPIKDTFFKRELDDFDKIDNAIIDFIDYNNKILDEWIEYFDENIDDVYDDKTEVNDDEIVNETKTIKELGDFNKMISYYRTLLAKRNMIINIYINDIEKASSDKEREAVKKKYAKDIEEISNDIDAIEKIFIDNIKNSIVHNEKYNFINDNIISEKSTIRISKNFNKIMSDYQSLLLAKQDIIKKYYNDIKQENDLSMKKKIKEDYLKKLHEIDKKIEDYESTFNYALLNLDIDYDNDDL